MSQSEPPIYDFMRATDIPCPGPCASACCRCSKLNASFLTDIPNSPKTGLAELDCPSDALVSVKRVLRLPGMLRADCPAEVLEAFEPFCDPRKPGVS